MRRLSCLAVVCIMAACQSVDSTEPAAMDGATLYQGHCATCHGMDGAGDGPMAALLKRPVPDLRAMTLTNKLAIIEVIDGRGTRPAHGSRDMPVWGWAFREVERSENAVQARLDALAEHILSLQQ